MSGVMNMLLGAKSAIAVAVDEFFNRVTLLLPGNGTNGAQNNTFLDSSTNNFTITRNGNTTQGTFSPFSQTGWSNYFDGTDDYLSVADNAVLRPGAGTFTLEAWIYRGASGAAHTIYAKGGASTGIVFQVTSTNVLRFTHTTTNIDSTGTISADTWTHVAVVREGTGTNQTKLYINGTQDGQGTVSTDFTQTEEVRIGTNRGATEDFNGYISNLRFTKGAALYTGNFTPSTSPLTTTSQGASATDVELLTCQSNRFVDNSSNAFSITVNGTPSVQAFSPFAPTAAYDAATVGGSGYFDGNGDYLANATAAVADFGTGDFTFECWFYLTALSTGSFYQIFSASNTVGAFQVYKTTTSNDIVWDVNGTKTLTLLSGSSLSANSWYHIAVVRSGSGSNNLKTYVNGSQTFQYTDTTNFTVTGAYVGAFPTGVSTWPGYIAGLRILKGTAQAPSGIPTAPPTAITNTSFLLNFTNAGITDATAKNDLETVGNAQISTTQSKFGGSSISFDGTGDYLLIPSSPNFALNGDATIEFWLRVPSLPSTYSNLFTINAAASLLIYLNSAGNIGIQTGSAYRDTTTAPISTNTWYHVAITKTSGNTWTVYVNGTSQASSGTGTMGSAISAAIVGIGATSAGANTLNGFIDDLRVSQFARYTSNFTAPTSAFALQ